jgi:hypothetical protein
VTTSASIFGYTPNYAPLEQIQGLGTDPRSDLYSLGATLYHLMTGVKPPDALTRAAALVNGQPDPLVLPSEANTAIAREVDHVLGKAMAQSREQRYASASEMRKALHGSAQAATIVNRGEAQTMLFPPPPATVAIPTQTVATPQTVATGETTVVRRGPRSKFLPIALSAAVVLLVACGVLGFYLLQGRSETDNELTAAPTPGETPSVVASPTADNSTAESPEANDKEPEAATAKQERASRNEEARKAPTPKPQQSPAAADAEGHSDSKVEVDPEVPTPPGYQGPPPKIETKRLPGGMVVRTFPDGTQIITMRDGMRVLVTKDGQKKVLNPPRPNRRRQIPPPAPSP